MLANRAQEFREGVVDGFVRDFNGTVDEIRFEDFVHRIFERGDVS
jgi:hypothetical protein